MDSPKLDRLLNQGEHYATFAMKQLGRIVPALFAETKEGPVVYFPTHLASDSAKDEFAGTARLICLGYSASAAVIVFEAWARFASPGEKLDTTEVPSEAFDRKEVVLLLGEEGTIRKYQLLPIIRTDAGGFFGFGTPPEPQTENFKGRFSRLLPAHAPTEAERAAARAVLSARGIQFGRPNTTE